MPLLKVEFTTSQAHEGKEDKMNILIGMFCVLAGLAVVGSITALEKSTEVNLLAMTVVLLVASFVLSWVKAHFEHGRAGIGEMREDFYSWARCLATVTAIALICLGYRAEFNYDWVLMFVAPVLFLAFRWWCRYPNGYPNRRSHARRRMRAF